MANNKISEMIAEAAKSFEGMINANAVIGEAIQTSDGTIIVPVSKLSFGFGGGGSEFDSKKAQSNPMNEPRFGGGMGGGASVQAEAFLVINNGNVRLISMGGGNSPVDKIIDMVPDIVDKVNGFISSQSDKRAAKKAAKQAREANDNYER